MSAVESKPMSEKPTPLTENVHYRCALYKGDVGRYRDMTEHARRLETALAVAEEVVRLSDELCTAIDNAAEDIGGSRRIGDILADLGPATDAALAQIEELRK